MVPPAHVAAAVSARAWSPAGPGVSARSPLLSGALSMCTATLATYGSHLCVLRSQQPCPVLPVSSGPCGVEGGIHQEPRGWQGCCVILSKCQLGSWHLRTCVCGRGPPEDVLAAWVSQQGALL